MTVNSHNTDTTTNNAHNCNHSKNIDDHKTEHTILTIHTVLY